MDSNRLKGSGLGCCGASPQAERPGDLGHAPEQRREPNPEDQQAGARRIQLLRNPEGQQHFEDADHKQ
jgi:hypothetical protein